MTQFNTASKDDIELIGVLGGTFDPVHTGHLRMALEVQSQLPVSRILFLPTPTPPHKNNVHASYTDRRAMLNLALARHDHFEISDIECTLSKPHYTTNTLKALRNTLQPHQHLCWIMGLDSLHQLPTWHCWRDLFTLCHLIVINRPEMPKSKESAISATLTEELAPRWCDRADTLQKHSVGKVITLNTPRLDIASRDLRRKIQMGQALDYLVTDTVIDYINQHRLYL